MPYAEFSNVLKIADHAHATLGSIPLIQMVQPDAREAVRTEAVLDLEFINFSHILIGHTTQDFDLRLSSPRQPGHGFLSLVYARQRRQFIPQEAISFVEIAVVFVDLFDVMSRSSRSYVITSLLKPNVAVDRRAVARTDLCPSQAPFITKQGDSFFETHHIIPLGLKGTDTKENTMALCSNCHRKMHVLNLENDINNIFIIAKSG